MPRKGGVVSVGLHKLGIVRDKIVYSWLVGLVVVHPSIVLWRKQRGQKESKLIGRNGQVDFTGQSKAH